MIGGCGWPVFPMSRKVLRPRLLGVTAIWGVRQQRFQVSSQVTLRLRSAKLPPGFRLGYAFRERVIRYVHALIVGLRHR